MVGYCGQRPNFSFQCLYLDGDVDAVDFWSTVSITYIKTENIVGWLQCFHEHSESSKCSFQDILNENVPLGHW